MPQRASTYTYVLLSLAFIIVNVATLGNLPPWIDEVMMLDTSYNAAVHGSWETTAWYRVAGQHPFSTYPPLYQMLATVWIWFMGGSLVAVRSLNLLITFVLGGVCLQLIKRHELQLALWTTALFTMLLWGTCEMAWMYRNGRPDMLCALSFVVTLLAIDNYLSAQSRTASIVVVAASALLLCSGIQTTVYLCSLWLFIFIVIKERRKEAIHLFVLLLTGIVLGLLMVVLFMLAHGRLVAFSCSIIQYSSTLSCIALKMLPWAGEVFGFDSIPYTQKLLEQSSEPSLGQRLAPITEYYSFIILSGLVLVAYATSFRGNLNKHTNDKGFLSFLFALSVPFIMNLAGRFPVYYRWMVFLPLVVAVTSIAARCRSWRAVFGLVAALLSVFGIKSMLPDGDWNYGNMRSFVERQHFKSSDAVVCPFSTFYDVKPVCDTCYFVGIFPMVFMGHVDYIIESPDGDRFNRRITDYVNKLKADTTVTITAIDHCENPSLTLYKVHTKND